MLVSVIPVRSKMKSPFMYPGINESIDVGSDAISCFSLTSFTYRLLSGTLKLTLPCIVSCCCVAANTPMIKTPIISINSDIHDISFTFSDISKSPLYKFLIKLFL